MCVCASRAFTGTDNIAFLVAPNTCAQGSTYGICIDRLLAFPPLYTCGCSSWLFVPHRVRSMHWARAKRCCSYDLRQQLCTLHVTLARLVMRIMRASTEHVCSYETRLPPKHSRYFTTSARVHGVCVCVLLTLVLPLRSHACPLCRRGCGSNAGHARALSVLCGPPRMCVCMNYSHKCSRSSPPGWSAPRWGQGGGDNRERRLRRRTNNGGNSSILRWKCGGARGGL